MITCALYKLSIEKQKVLDKEQELETTKQSMNDEIITTKQRMTEELETAKRTMGDTLRKVEANFKMKLEECDQVKEEVSKICGEMLS